MSIVEESIVGEKESPLARHQRLQKEAKQAFDWASAFSAEHAIRIEPQYDRIRIAHPATDTSSSVIISKQGAQWLLNELHRILGV